MRWATVDSEGRVQRFDEKERAPAAGERVIEITDEQWQEYLENQQERAFDAEGQLAPFTPPPPPLAELKRRKAVEFTLLMDEEIRALLSLPVEDSEILPNYLEMALVLQTRPADVNTIWQHYRRKVAEIRAAADQSALEAINWRP